MCLAKALSAGNGLNTVVTQDLTLGEGGALEAGDSAEIKYTGWLLTNSTFGQVFDTNTNADKLFRFKLGAGKVIKVQYSCLLYALSGVLEASGWPSG